MSDEIDPKALALATMIAVEHAGRDPISEEFYLNYPDEAARAIMAYASEREAKLREELERVTEDYAQLSARCFDGGGTGTSVFGEAELRKQERDAALAEVERLLYTSDKQTVAWKDRAIKAEGEVERLKKYAVCRVCATAGVGLPTPGYTHDAGCPKAWREMAGDARRHAGHSALCSKMQAGGGICTCGWEATVAAYDALLKAEEGKRG